MCEVQHLYRHPIKALGWEAIDRAEIAAGKTFPGDRLWAVAHEAARLQPGWNRHNNFIRGASSAALMAIGAETQPDGRITLTHPDRPAITVDPDVDQSALIDWVRPLCDPARARPVSVYRTTAQGLTDNVQPYHTLLNLASLRALEGQAGCPLDPRRFRGNIWFEGDGPWQEFQWVGREITVGDVRYSVEARVDRCSAPDVNLETLQPDTCVLRDLEGGWGHKDFGVFLRAETSGMITLGDKIVP